MDNEPADPLEKERSLVKRWRESFLPIRPKDPASVRLIKHSAFYLFAVMLVLITVAIALAILFVL
jgi:hypothetical protein